MSGHARNDIKLMSVAAGQSNHLFNCCVKFCATVVILLIASFAVAQDFGFTLDFEQGDLRGWDVSGNAFRFQPTLNDNPSARNRGMPSGHQGKYWIGTYEQYQGKPRQILGAIQGDKPQGAMVSPSFKGPGGTLSFLIGGGAQPETRVELYVDKLNGQPPVHVAYGLNDESMRRVTWDIAKFVGQSMYIRIVDESSSGWGHINVDDFRFSTAAAQVSKIKIAKMLQDLVGTSPEVLVNPDVEIFEVRTIDVPRLNGRYLDKAKNVLMTSGLETGSTTYMNAGEKRDIVIRQAPGFGTKVLPGTAVNLYVSRGPPQVVEVPNVIGKQIDIAREAILTQRLVIDRALSDGQTVIQSFKIGKITRANSEQAKGIVIDQKPRAPTEVTVGTSIDLMVSAGLPMVVVPNVIDQDVDTATRLIQAKKLGVGRVTNVNSEQAPGTVIDQTPRAPTEVTIGSSIDLVESSGPIMVVVPHVIDRDVDTATRLIGKENLRTGRISQANSERAEGIVIDQQPRALTEVTVGTSIDLVVSSNPNGVPPVSVPNLPGLSMDDARSEILRSGLQTGSISKEISLDRPDTVISQNPSSGTLVASGSTVDLVVASLALWFAAGSVALLSAGVAVYKLWPRPIKRFVTTELHMDTGSIEPEYSDATPIVMELSTRFVVDSGRQDVDVNNGAIKSKREDNEND